MPSHMNAIGFPMETDADYLDLAKRTAREGSPISSPRGTYVRWAAGGAELWVHYDGGGENVGLNPHFAGDGQMVMRVTEVIEFPGHPLDGSLHGWASPAVGESEDGLYPFVVDLPDFDVTAARLQTPRIVTLQVAAFAEGELGCFADEEAFAARHERFATKCFIPAGLFLPEPPPDGGPIEPPQARGIFSGHIVSAEVVANPATGAPYHHLLVETYGGSVDVVADPVSVVGTPAAGGIVMGDFWLSARIVGAAP